MRIVFIHDQDPAEFFHTHVLPRLLWACGAWSRVEVEDYTSIRLTGAQALPADFFGLRAEGCWLVE